MSAILSHRSMVEAQEYGVDSDAVSEAQKSQTTKRSDADNWQPASEGRAQSPDDTTQSTERISGHSPQGSSTSSNDWTGSAPPAKRPRRGKLTELAELMQEQHSTNADMLMDRAELMFEQQKELMKESNYSFKETMTGTTASFLQGTQNMLAQLISQPPQLPLGGGVPFKYPWQRRIRRIP
ncbi:uncharacterized protein LOC119457343 [Dermacentor silvarum]|uniref:uncharacterized protein LOC119457343 n=1 Tax=Dermacentor silvarum TaxID=543639 RepID=UPI0021017754|nr:uncharacterized protein LOC119457343 [Dermacentor silvarum]